MVGAVRPSSPQQLKPKPRPNPKPKPKPIPNPNPKPKPKHEPYTRHPYTHTYTQARRGDDFRLVVMSATLDAARFVDYFPGAVAALVRGRQFPVQVGGGAGRGGLTGEGGEGVVNTSPN